VPLVSFSGEPTRGPFWALILSGAKRQTVRLPRRGASINVGDRLVLYWKVRVPKSKKDIHKIGEAVCSAIEYLRFSEFAHDDAFAYADGFLNSCELRDWFGAVLWDTMFTVIHWDNFEEATH
jgi:hypothetical protein